jgi:hypothetical protein
MTETTKALEVRVEQKLGLLNWNFEELNAQLDAQLEKYRGLTFTDDQMPEAKKTRATLNRVAKEINDRKIAVKKEFCEPYERFEDQAKILIGKIKDVSGAIDQQVKDYETAKKDAKRKQISDWWKLNGDANVPIEKVFDERWLNTTCSEARWKSELEETKTRIRNQIYTITMMAEDVGPEKLDFLLAEYMKKLSLEDAVSAWKIHEEAVKRAAVEKERIERERLQREAERAEIVTETQPQATAEPEPQLSREDYLYSPTYKMIDLTLEQAKELIRFFNDNHLQFEVLAKEKRRK